MNCRLRSIRRAEVADQLYCTGFDERERAVSQPAEADGARDGRGIKQSRPGALIDLHRHCLPLPPLRGVAMAAARDWAFYWRPATTKPPVAVGSSFSGR